MAGDGGSVRFTRRQALLGAGALTGMAVVGSAGTDGGSAGSSQVPWPTRSLGPQAAMTVDATQFLPVTQLKEWHEQLDAMGMRSTGAPIHEQYVDELVGRLKQVGVDHVHTEPVPLERWTASSWSLGISRPAGVSMVPTASYIPYSRATSAAGVEGPLAVVASGQTPAPGSLPGKIALFQVPTASIPYSTMESIAYCSYD